MIKYKGKNFFKSICNYIVIVMLILYANCLYVNAEVIENETARFYMDKEVCNVTAGDEVNIKLNINAMNMVGCLSVLEYDKELTLINIKQDDKLNGTKIYSPQLDENGKISEIQINDKKRFVFTFIAKNNREITIENQDFAEITLKTPVNVPKGKTFTVGWNTDVDNTYIEDFKGSKTLELLQDCNINIIESDYVESKPIEDNVNNIIQNGEINNSGDNENNIIGGNNVNSGNSIGSENNIGSEASIGSENNNEDKIKEEDKELGKDEQKGEDKSNIQLNQTSQNGNLSSGNKGNNIIKPAVDSTVSKNPHVQAGSMQYYICYSGIIITIGLIIVVLYLKYKNNESIKRRK